MRHAHPHELALRVTVLLLGAALRLYGLNWDGGIEAHPDERYIVETASSLAWPLHVNPFESAPDYAYGHVPLYALMLLRSLGGGDSVLVAARGLNALLDLGTVALAGGLARRVFGWETGILAMALAALAPLHVQQARFFTADVWATFFSLGALWSAVRLAEGGGLGVALGCGLALGLAVGSKFSACLLVLPVGAAWAVLPSDRRRRCGLATAGAALGAFAITNPFALVEARTWWHNLSLQMAITGGSLDAPFTRQFHGTLPYVYPAEQLLRWGFGLLLGVVSGIGLGVALVDATRRPNRSGEWVLLAWVLPGLALWGALYARFPRYLLPFTPLLCVYAARLAVLAPSVAPFGRRRRWLRQQSGRTLLYGLLLGELGLRTLAYTGMLSLPHPWLEASRFLHQHTGPGAAVVAVEEWDQPLPLDSAGFELVTLPLFAEDSGEKWSRVARWLARADYVVVASHRGYGALARWPSRYPLTANYYRLLFRGELGFEPVGCFVRRPRLGRLLVLADDPTHGLGWSLPSLCDPQSLWVWRLGRLDESLIVYDHPLTVVFARGAAPLGPEEIEARIVGSSRN